MKHFLATFILAASMLALTNNADANAIQLSLVPGVQLVDKEKDVDFLRLAIVGQNNNVTGIDLGIGGLVDGNFKGVGLDLIHNVKGDMQGLQWSAWNYAGGEAAGLQLGYINGAKSLSGVQVGLINYTEDNGVLQIGGINVGNCSKGWQIGFINVNTNPDATLPFMVFVNGSF